MNGGAELFHELFASRPGRGDVGGRKVAAAAVDLAGPPILVRLIDHGYKFASAELKLASLLGCEVVERSNDELGEETRDQTHATFRWNTTAHTTFNENYNTQNTEVDLMVTYSFGPAVTQFDVL
jgi:hypothetical protein